jgi:exonuclease III
MDIRNYYYKILSWNVRGLNSMVRQENVRHVINTYKPELIYLQETKMALISPGVV